jgi:uncharacterized secreted protein with C-terminal beta-propeller domain
MKKVSLICKVFILSLALLSSVVVLPSKADNVADTKSTGSEIFIHIDSPLLLSAGKILPLDPQNLDVAATIADNRTLVPLRAISEYFGADVSYDTSAHKAVITYKGNKFLFPVGSAMYIQADGKKDRQIAIDTKTVILNGRTMVPLKAICEDILGRKVSYYDDVIAIGDSRINLKEDKNLLTGVKLKIGSALKARSLDQLKSVMSSRTMLYGREDIIQNGDIVYAAEISKSADTVQSNTDYSATNVQVQGIDEADIVKTDGKYIYYVGSNAVRIVKAENGKLKDVSSIKLTQDKNVSEIYTDKNRLVVIGSKATYIPQYRPQVSDDIQTTGKRAFYPHYTSSYSFADVYDISVPENPVFIKGHEMEGNYQSSRKNGSIVYMITNNYIYNNDKILPMMRDSSENKEPVQLPLKDIMILPGCRPSGYVIVSAIDINNTSKTKVEAITTSSQLTYMNSSALYLASDNYNGNSTITKFIINGMNIGYSGSGEVKGSILNQFSMDEYNGNFRVATTGNNENNLFVLDSSLNISGSVTGLAKGERIYSVRFIGDKGYIVTFRTMDPLFVFDLSDPKNPKVTGELKIPGFSNYLHPVGENLLLGIGQDTYDIFKKDSSGKEVVIGSRQGGIKLSLFDVSDMGKPKEVSNYILGDSGSYSEAFYNHKAVMVDNSSGNIVFDAYISDTSGKSQRGAAVFSLGGKSIKLNGIVPCTTPERTNSLYIPYGCRTIYIGDMLYYVHDGVISSYNYKTLAPVDTLVLN